MGLTRKEIQKDEIRSVLTDIWHYALLYQAQIIGGLVVVALLLLSYWGWNTYQAGRAREANVAFAHALETYHAPVDDPSGEEGGEDESAPPQADAGERSFASEEAKYQAALEQFQAVAEDYAGTPVAPWARLYIGLIKAEQGEGGEEILSDLASGASAAEVRNLAAKRLVDRHLQAGDLDQAIAYCRRIVDDPAVNFPVEDTILTLAELYEKKGDTEAALEQYRVLQSEYPNSPQAASAETKIEELAPPLLGADGEQETPEEFPQQQPPSE